MLTRRIYQIVEIVTKNKGQLLTKAQWGGGNEKEHEISFSKQIFCTAEAKSVLKKNDQKNSINPPPTKKKKKKN